MARNSNGRAYRIPRQMAKLDPKVISGILSYIRGGAHDFVAAEAHGIDREVWTGWMERGIRGEDGFIDLYAQVAQASAQARALSEMDLRTNNTLAWLKFGPARDKRRGGAGWGDEKITRFGQASEEQSFSLEIVDASLRLEAGDGDED